ncbi:MAG: type secretion system protein [Acidobacteria bacterium]|nr:type secretion system protein [Acidobacteriota bacterium]
MPAYTYKASTFEGKIVEGSLEASDTSAAALKIQDMGLLPIRVGAAAGATALTREMEWPWKRKRVRRKDLLVFTQELHTLVKASFPLDRSLAILGQLAESPALAEIVQDVLKEVKGGKSLSEALGKYPETFPKVYVSMVKAGEASGALEEILARLAAFLEQSENLRSYIFSALIYPMLLAVVGTASMIILTLFVVPRFSSIFKDMGIPMPLPMVILRGISAVISGYWWAFLALIILAFFYIRRILATPEGRLNWDRRLLRIPLIGNVLRKVEVARFARTLGTLLHGGVPLLQSMNIVRDIISNQGIASTIDPIRNGIKKGEGITSPMKQSGVFPPLAMHLIEVGEESGRLDTMLVQVAEVYDTEVRDGIKNLISFFEPALILLMGLAIATIVVSMLMAIFSINDVPI